MFHSESASTLSLLTGWSLWGSVAKPDPFFRVEPNFGPKIWVELGQVGPQGRKTSPIGLGWPQIGFKFGFNPIMYLLNPISQILGFFDTNSQNFNNFLLGITLSRKDLLSHYIGGHRSQWK